MAHACGAVTALHVGETDGTFGTSQRSRQGNQEIDLMHICRDDPKSKILVLAIRLASLILA
jgi:hypothetical protein